MSNHIFASSKPARHLSRLEVNAFFVASSAETAPKICQMHELVEPQRAPRRYFYEAVAAYCCCVLTQKEGGGGLRAHHSDVAFGVSGCLCRMEVNEKLVETLTETVRSELPRNLRRRRPANYVPFQCLV